MSIRNLIVILAAGASLTACGSDLPTRTGPLGASTPPLPRPPVQVWTGTFVSANWSFSPFRLDAQITQTENAIEGNWFDTQWGDVGGTIKGTLDGESFTGTITINGCPGAFTGTMTATNVNWSSPGVSADCARIFPSVPNPVDIKFLLSR